MQPPQSTPSILIAEDDVETAALLAQILRDAPWQVDFATDGQETLDRYRNARDEERPYSLLVLDVALPTKSGVTVAEELRGEERRATDVPVPIAFFTADDTPLFVIRARAVHPIGIWRKPEAILNIRQLIEQALRSASNR